MVVMPALAETQQGNQGVIAGVIPRFETAASSGMAEVVDRRALVQEKD